MPKKLIVYCCLSFGILIASVLKKDIDFSQFENRTLAYLKRPTYEDVLSGEWFQSFETYNLDQVIARDHLVFMNSRLLHLLGKKQINLITVGTNDTLIQTAHEFPAVSDQTEPFLSDVLIPFRNATESYGGQFFYINKYPRHLFFWKQFPYHEDEKKDSYIEANQKEISALTGAGICVVDSYKPMMEHADEYLYYHTDHHYTYKGAYYTYLALLDAINQNNPDKPDLSFPAWEQMQAVRPQGKFWGSLIPQIGDTLYEGLDYLEYALPDDFPTKYERYESGVLSDMPLVRVDTTTEYGWFMNGDYGNTVIKTNRPELPNILLIGYSFTDALELMAVYNFNEMHSIDPRAYDGDIEAYIKEAECDYVVVQDVIALN